MTGMMFVDDPETLIAGEQQLVGNGARRFEDTHYAKGIGISVYKILIFNEPV